MSEDFEIEARILDASPEEYHRLPGLSSSIATTLITRSPLHAYHEHPAFGSSGRAPTFSMDLGTIGHAIVLGKGKAFAPCPFDDWRTKAAQASRDKYREAGLVPILTHHLDRAERMAASALQQLEERGIRLTGRSELPVEWHEPSPRGPVQCRGMFDHVWLDDGVILDLKFVENAETSHVERSGERFGYAIQSTAYTRALTALRPQLAGRVRFLYAFIENDEPFALNLMTPSGALRALGEKRWLRAVRTWAACLATNEWPAYGLSINRLGAPAWALAQEEI